MSLARNISDLPNGDDAPLYGVRAWAYFKDSTLYAGGNQNTVTSISDNGTANWTFNFNALPDSNYSISAFIGFDNRDQTAWLSSPMNTALSVWKTTTSVNVVGVYSNNASNADTDTGYVHLIIVR